MNRIIWKPWNNPLAPLLRGYRPQEDEEDADFHAARQTWMEDEDDVATEEVAAKTISTGPVLLGPMGIIPLRESNNPSSLFNFWMADVNFDLDEAAVQAIEEVPGVETLDVFTRYRFRLGIGRAFNEREVMRAIEQATCPRPPVKVAIVAPVGDSLDDVKRMLTKRFAFWAIFETAKGRYEFAGGKTREEVQEKAKRYKEVSKTILSWEKS